MPETKYISLKQN